ncbi:hypothetical protein ACTGX4_11375, partial [Streptococcus suis]
TRRIIRQSQKFNGKIWGEFGAIKLKTLVYQGFSLCFHLPCRNFIAKHVVVCFKKYADFSYFCYIFDLSILIF